MTYTVTALYGYGLCSRWSRGKDGVYRFRFLSVSDGFQSPPTPYYYFVNPIGHIAIKSQVNSYGPI